MNDPVFQGDGWPDYLYWQRIGWSMVLMRRVIYRSFHAEGIIKTEPHDTK